MCVLAVLAVLGATLWPFNPFPRNGVVWLQDTPGLTFEKDGVVLGSASLAPPENDAKSYTLELLLQPASVIGSQTILVFYRPHASRELRLRRYLDGLVVTHDDRVYNDSTRSITFFVGQVFRAGQIVQVTVSSGSGGTVVYIDGQIADRIPSFTITRNDLSGEIILGSSPVSHNSWRGEVCGLAIYSKELMPAEALQHFKDWTAKSANRDLLDALALYDFDARTGHEVQNKSGSGLNLEIPETYSVPHKEFLRSPASEFKLSWEYANDVLMNIAGFIPLGVIVCAYFQWSASKRKSVLVTTLVCGLLSLVIEILQYYIPRRGSGMTDILTNSLGALIGAMLVQARVIRRLLELMKLVPETRPKELISHLVAGD